MNSQIFSAATRGRAGSSKHLAIQNDADYTVSRSQSVVSFDRAGLVDDQMRPKNTRRASRSSSREAERPAAVRKRTVFEDLPTAHSSITSRSRSHHRTASQQAAENYEDRNSIPLHEFVLPDRHNDEFHLGHLAQPPRVAVVTNHLRGSPDLYLNAKEARPISRNLPRLEPPPQEPRLATSTSVFASFKNAIASISSGAPRDGPSQKPVASHWHGGSGDDLAEGMRRESVRPNKRTQRHRPNSFELASNRPAIHNNVGSNGLNVVNIADDSSIYRSSLGAAPSESLPRNSNDNRIDIGMRNFGPRNGVDGTEYHPFYAGGLHDGSSFPDGSTVGNIYRHYMHEGDDGSSHNGGSENDCRFFPATTREAANKRASGEGFGSSPTSKRLKLSASHSGKQLQADGAGVTVVRVYPPRIVLSKKINHLVVQHVTPSTSQGISHASSYSDTQRLLELTQGTNRTKGELAVNGLGPDGVAGPSKSYSTRLNPLKDNNPFVQTPQVVISPAEGNPSANDAYFNSQFNAQERVPLEREVSKALRRASGYSAYSGGSISTIPAERYNDLPSETSTYRAIKTLLRRNAEIIPSSDTSSIKGERVYIAPLAKGFYDQRAIASNWGSTRRNNAVRVPINHNGSFPDSPPDSPPDDIETPFGRKLTAGEEDGNDWETVGESALGKPLNRDFLGGTVRRAGSSVANYSDGDSIPELDSFGSTDRIAQHPGNMEYSGDYRQRDLKKSHIPVFLPVFREHKVNGYLADSTRIRPPPNPFYKTPLPLVKTHENPFKTPPPEVMMSSKNRHRNANHFPPAAQSHLVEDHPRMEEREQQARQPHGYRRSSQDSNWMDDFGDPGPMINNQSEQVLRATALEHVVAYHDTIPLDGSYKIGESSHNVATKDRQSAILDWQHKTQTDGLIESQAHGSKVNKKSRKPFIKGPPGAFYQGLRAVSDGKRNHSSRNLSRQESLRGHPTNALRPLSLLADRRPSTPQGQIIPDPNDSPGNDFIYRSPLAPPRRNSWQQLYSESQMRNIREAAKADGIFSSQLSIASGLRQSMRNMSSQKHLFEAPRLAIFSRKSISTQFDLVCQKKKVSNVVLCLCVFFPPMLVLYAMGALDGIMSWWTRGQVMTFGRKQRRVAFILVYVWALLIFLVLVAFLVCWFVILHPPDAMS